MPTDFPGGVDDITNDVTNSTVLTDLHPSLHNDLADAIMALETEVLAGGGGGTVADGSITSAKIADGTIVAGDLADGAVTSAKILDGTIAAGDMASGAAATNVGTLGGSLNGTLPNPTLAANSVGASQIADGTVGTAEIANANVTNAKLASDTARASLLVNSGLEVWQRGNGPFTANGAYTADRWVITLVGTDTLSVSRNTANADVAMGSIACAACVFVLGTGAGVTSFSQSLKAADTSQLAGRAVTVSVRIRTTTANAARLGVHDGSAWTYSSSHTGDGAYQSLTATATITATGTAQIGVFFAVSCTAYIDNAMLVVGSVAADYAPLHPADDLARCQRYYEIIGGANGNYLGSGQAFSTTQALHTTYMKVSKATTPTVTASAAGTFTTTNGTAGNVTCTGIASASINTAGPYGIVATVASGLTAGQGSILAALAGNTASIALEANP